MLIRAGPYSLGPSTVVYGFATVSWDGVAGATEYQIERTPVTAGTTTVTSTRFNGTTSATEINHVFANGGTDSTAAYVDNVVVTVTPVPEPASLGALALGAGLLLARRRRNGDAA